MHGTKHMPWMQVLYKCIIHGYQQTLLS